MAKSLLITECLQNDFVKPIGRHDVLPNLLHIGFDETTRLMGLNAEEGPVARFMAWAYAQDEQAMDIIHIRDWHDADDPRQQAHLEHFGRHCLKDSDGGKFAFATGSERRPAATVIDSLTLNDFQDTSLAERLSTYQGHPLRVGLIGVWTEAKITYLAYELRTRYPSFELATCSALTASSSRLQHFNALDQMKKILGVRIYTSIADFAAFLCDQDQPPLMGSPQNHQVDLHGIDEGLDRSDRELAAYLFRHSRELHLRALAGGFSGNHVLLTRSIDGLGHEEVPHVLKIGPRALIGQERDAFERIENVLGNSAPRIVDFAELENRGAIKYRYASMDSAASQTFQHMYVNGAPLADIQRVLNTVFTTQLGRLYQAATPEPCELLDYYAFSSEYADGVQAQIDELLGSQQGRDGHLDFPQGITCSDVAQFYREIDELPRTPGETAPMAYVHGDLNGANIIIDSNDNIWLIDFFHTHRGHLFRDFAKLENDILFIYMAVDEQTFRVATTLIDALLTHGIGESPAKIAGLPAALERAYQTLRHLRGLFPEAQPSNTRQYRIAQLRYAVHTLSFDESSIWQRRLALYMAGRCVESIDKD